MNGPSSYSSWQCILQQSCHSHAIAPGVLSSKCESFFLSHFLVILRSFCTSPSSRLRSDSQSRAIEWISLFSLLKNSQRVLLPWQWDLSGNIKLAVALCKIINVTLWYYILLKWLILPFIQEIFYRIINIGNIHVGINGMWMKMQAFKSTRKRISEQVPNNWWALIAPEHCTCDFAQMTKERKKKLTHKVKVENSAGAIKYSVKEKVKLMNSI